MPCEEGCPPQEDAMMAKLYTLNEMPAPFRIVVLGDPQEPARNGKNMLLEGLRTAPLEEYQVSVRNESLLHRQYGHDNATEWEPASPPLAPQLKAPASEISISEIMFPSIPPELFTWPYTNENQISVEEGKQSHNQTLRLAMSKIKVSPKYFHEVNFKDDPAGYGSHYDWRFFREILAHDEHRAVLNAMARTWQQFAEQAGIVYWYAHGSLLGHYWNGLAMPWDADHDIQVPVMELDRLARDFNHTLIVQNSSEEGHHKFLIDVNPFYVKRMHGNGNNVIDARFIDIDTGAYIDITGLARVNPNRRIVSCKNRHYYQTNDFKRLRRTVFEGYPALIPAQYEPMLATEYATYKSPTYKRWSFNSKIRIWEYQESCYAYLRKYQFSNHVFCYPQDIRDDGTCLEKYGTCDHVSISQFELLGNVTAMHNEEVDIFNKINGHFKRPDWSQEDLVNIESLMHKVGTFVPPLIKSERNNYQIAKVRGSDK